MRKKLSHTWLVLSAAFIISCLLWYLVIMDDSPRVHISLGNVPVTVLNGSEVNDAGYAYFFEELPSVEVSVNVIQQRGWFVDASDIRLTANLLDASLKEGESQIYIHSEVVANQSVIGSNYKLAKNTLKVRFEELKTITVPVHVAAKGEPSTGYSAGVFSQSLEHVEVRLPESLADDGIYAQAVVDLSDADKSFEKECNLTFYNSSGTVIDPSTQQLLAEQKTVNVSVPIGVKKKVALELPDYRNAAASGYRCTSVELEKSSITVVVPDGTAEPADTITIPLSMLGLSTKKDRNYELTLQTAKLFDDGISFYSEEDMTDTVWIIVEKLGKKSVNLDTASIDVKINEQMTLEIQADSVAIEVEGLSDDLDKLDGTSFHASLDLTGKGAGGFTVVPTVVPADDLSVKDQIRVLSVSGIRIVLKNKVVEEAKTDTKTE